MSDVTVDLVTLARMTSDWSSLYEVFLKALHKGDAIAIERDKLKQELSNKELSLMSAVKDHSEDWRRIQDAERKLEAAVKERDEAREALEHVSYKMGNEYLKFKAERDHALESVKMATEKLERIATIRNLPLTDMNDTDEERADQYSSVINTLALIARETLAKLKERHGELKKP